MTPESEFARAELLLGAPLRREIATGIRMFDAVFAKLDERKSDEGIGHYPRPKTFVETVRMVAQDYDEELATLLARSPEAWREICASFFREYPEEIVQAFEPEDDKVIAVAFESGDHAYIGTIVAKAMYRYIGEKAAKLYEMARTERAIERSENQASEWSGERTDGVDP